MSRRESQSVNGRIKINAINSAPNETASAIRESAALLSALLLSF